MFGGQDDTMTGTQPEPTAAPQDDPLNGVTQLVGGVASPAPGDVGYIHPDTNVASDEPEGLPPMGKLKEDPEPEAILPPAQDMPTDQPTADPVATDQPADGQATAADDATVDPDPAEPPTAEPAETPADEPVAQEEPTSVPTTESATEPEPEPDPAPVTTTEPPANDDPTGADDTTMPTTPPDDNLLELKQHALQQLAPLVDHLDQTPEERFRTTMMLIQASDNKDLLPEAYDAAEAIEDEKIKAQALLDVINEINYFTQKPNN